MPSVCPSVRPSLLARPTNHWANHNARPPARPPQVHRFELRKKKRVKPTGLHVTPPMGCEQQRRQVSYEGFQTRLSLPPPFLSFPFLNLLPSSLPSLPSCNNIFMHRWLVGWPVGQSDPLPLLSFSFPFPFLSPITGSWSKCLQRTLDASITKWQAAKSYR